MPLDTETLPPPTPAGVEPQLFEMIWTALKESPQTRTLSQEQLESIAVKAIHEGSFGDELWLQQQIRDAEDASPHIPGSRIPKIPISQPASIESQEDLDAVVQAHKDWMDAVLHPSKANLGGRANLSGCDLRGLNLEGVDLRGANFSKANLAGCQAAGANLSTANFTGANLEGATLQGAKLRRCLLRDTNLAGCNLLGADLRRVTLDNCNLKDAKIDEVGIPQTQPT